MPGFHVAENARTSGVIRAVKFFPEHAEIETLCGCIRPQAVCFVSQNVV